MLLVSWCLARSALIREESRGGHTREDFPGMRPNWRKVNLICEADGEGAAVHEQPLPPMRLDLLQLFDRGELAKYMTEEELAVLDGGSAADGVDA
jgi:succinate dehydrogenase / fumarate reductase flavoprotein subunit